MAEGFSNQILWCGMVSADPDVDLEKFLALCHRDTFHKHACRRWAAIVELAVNDDESFGPSCDSPGLIPISGKNIKDVCQQVRPPGFIRATQCAGFGLCRVICQAVRAPGHLVGGGPIGVGSATFSGIFSAIGGFSRTDGM